MADVHTPEQRSYNMSHIRGKNTRPEELVRRYLFAQGFRYRKNDARFPGKPDIVLPKTRLLLVDDVVTSGNTLLCAYDLLQEHRYKIEALALCANPRFVESCEKKDLKRKGMFSIL